MAKIIKVTKVDGSIDKGMACFLNVDHILFFEDQSGSHVGKTRITLANGEVSPVSVDETKEEILALIHADNLL